MTKPTMRNLTEKINEEHRLVKELALSALEHARQAGALLAEAKAGIPHGEWGAWLAEHFDGSERQAQRYTKIHARWGELEAYPTRVSDIPLREGLRLLSEPREADRHARISRAEESSRYLPKPGCWALFIRPGHPGLLFVAPSEHAGFFHVANVLEDVSGGGFVEGTTRPVRADGIHNLVHHDFKAGPLRHNDYEPDDLDDWGRLPWTYNPLLFESEDHYLQERERELTGRAQGEGGHQSQGDAAWETRAGGSRTKT